jgi:hypothetical protein
MGIWEQPLRADNVVSTRFHSTRHVVSPPPTGDHKGPPISIKLRKEEVKRKKGKLASGDRIL